MPVSYDNSSLLKCTVGFTYLRYFTGDAENHLQNAGDEWMEVDLPIG